MRLYSGSWSLWRELRNWKWDRDMRGHFIVLLGLEKEGQQGGWGECGDGVCVCVCLAGG